MIARLFANRPDKSWFQSIRCFASSVYSSGHTVGPCDSASLHQFGDIFASVATRPLAAKILKIHNKLVKRKSITSEYLSDSVEESIREMRRLGVDESRAAELSRLLRRCMCCPDLKRFLRPEKQQTIEDTVGEDETVLPAGVDLELFSITTTRNRLGPSVSATFDPAPNFPSQTRNEFTCYIHNLPLRVDEDCIRSALRNVGNPSNILIYDTRGIPVVSGAPGKRLSRTKLVKPKASSLTAWMRFASPINAIVTFDSQHEFSKATMLENKLFGIQCRSTDTSIDSARPMLIEPARYKTNLLVSGFPEEMVWPEFKSRFELLAQGSLSLNDQQPSRSTFSGSNLFDQRLVINCSSFEIAYEILKRAMANPINPSISISFSRFRTQWRDEEKLFTDSVYFEKISDT